VVSSSLFKMIYKFYLSEKDFFWSSIWICKALRFFAATRSFLFFGHFFVSHRLLCGEIPFESSQEKSEK